MSSKLTDFLTLKSLPFSPDCGLLALRLWLGGSMLMIHGLDKFKNFNGTLKHFHDQMHISTPLAAAAILAESVFAGFLAIGFATRLSALILIINMSVAFFQVHHMSFKQGELAFLYLGGFVAIFLAGPGKFSVDEKIR